MDGGGGAGVLKRPLYDNEAFILFVLGLVVGVDTSKANSDFTLLFLHNNYYFQLYCQCLVLHCNTTGICRLHINVIVEYTATYSCMNSKR